MLKHSKIVLPSLESHDDVIEEGAPIEIDYTDQVAEEYAREAAIDGRDLEQQMDAVEAGMQDYSSLESLIEAIEEVREVGMEAGSAQFMHIQLSSVQKRYAINDLETSAPSLEAFNDRQARLATSLTLESIKETAQKVWAWIVEQFRKFQEMIITLFRKMTKNLDYIHAEADKLKQKARRMKFEGGQKINLGLRVANKISGEDGIPEDFISPLNTVGAITRVSEETFEKIYNGIVKTVVEDGEFPTEMILPVPQGWGKISRSDLMRINPTSARALSPDAYLHSSPTLPGNRSIFVSSKTSESRTVPFSPVAVVRVKQNENHEAIALSSEQVFTLCQRLQKTIASIKTSQQAMEDHVSRCKKTIDEGVRKHMSDRGHEGKVAPAVFTKLFQFVSIYGGKLHREAENIAFDVCVGYLTYAKRSIALAEQEQEKESATPSSLQALPAPSAA